MQRGLATLPRSFVLGGRTPEYDLPLDGEHAYITSDGCAMLRARARRHGTPLDQGRRGRRAKVVQGLANISATSALVSAQDCPVETRVLHEFDACMRTSEKHAIVVSVKDETEARA